MENRLLTTAEAAELLGVSKAFLERDRWAKGPIPFVKIGARAVRYERAALDAYIEEHRSRPATDPALKW